MKTTLLTILLAAAAAGGVSGQLAPQAFPERVTVAPAASVPPLVGDRALAETLRAAGKIRHFTPPTPKLAVAGETPIGPTRIGQITRLVEPARPEPAGTRALAVGTKVQRLALAVQSRSAGGLRIHFQKFDVGTAQVIVWSEVDGAQIVRGPFTGMGPDNDGTFWSPTLPGDTAFIEVIGGENPQLEVAEIIHQDAAWHASLRQPSGGGDRGGRGGVLGCHADVMCQPVNTVARDAVGQINFLRGDESFVCSGCLLSDLDPETVIPYFLTAYHCINTAAEAKSMEVVFLWRMSACNGRLPDYNTLPRLTGGKILASNPTDGGNDMVFIRLNGSVPSGVALAGWNTTDDPDFAYGIHHPAGSYQRYTSFALGSILACTFSNDPNDYNFYRCLTGVTEGGSSGSPLFNVNGQVIGQLYGSCFLAGVTPQCSNRDAWRAVYGEMQTTYPLIYTYLAIGGTIHVRKNALPPWNGSPLFPYPNVTLGNAVTFSGCQLKIQAQEYPEAVTFSTKMTVLSVGGSTVIGNHANP